MTCHMHVAVPIQPANSLDMRACRLIFLFPITTLEDLGHRQGGMGSMIWATHIQLGPPRDAKNCDVCYVGQQGANPVARYFL